MIDVKLERYHLLKYPESPGIFPNIFYPALLINPFKLSITSPEPESSGLSKNAELEIEKAPENLFKFCLRVTLLNN